MTELGDLAKVAKQNSGPFEITLDVLFDSKEQYDRVKQSGVITKGTICELYQIREEQIHHLVFSTRRWVSKSRCRGTYRRAVSAIATCTVPSGMLPS